MKLKRTDNAALFWNWVLLEAMKTDSKRRGNQQEQGGPTRTSRAAAIVHAAIHNAVNGVRQRNAFYQDPKTGKPVSPGSPPTGASQEAAGAGAAYRALVVLYRSQEAAFNKARADFQALPLPGANHQPSFQYGQDVAQQLLDARASDGSASADTYKPPTPGPGVWVPNPTLAPPGPPLTPGWGNVRLFLLDSISRVRPPRFPALTDGDYTLAFRNVRDKGGAEPPPPRPPQGPTEDEKNIALFFSYDDRLGSPIRLYNIHAFEILNKERNTSASLHRHARMFALINIAMADAGIACWEAKFSPPPGYHIWRPFQGIRGADNDGNNETQAIKNWLPLGRPQARDAEGEPVRNTTPNFPAYVSGHSSIGTALYGMLRKFFGAEFPFTLSSEEVRKKRSYMSWTQVIDENGTSRIFLGVHWRQDDTRGRALGQQVADYIWDNFLRPTT